MENRLQTRFVIHYGNNIEVYSIEQFFISDLRKNDRDLADGGRQEMF